uniref:Arrestin C-terminal-like domain-containing protein n=1 Tax=Heliothis virescens TaxID=7102 RepID=A0A2A4JRA1_HELVI
MSVKCQILLTNTEDGVFRAGLPVSGKLKYSLDTVTRYDSIDISLIGKGWCRWSETDCDTVHFFLNKEDNVTLTKNIFNAKPNDGKVLAGKYEYLFKFILPVNVPSSFKNKTCTIIYKVIAKFVESGSVNHTDKFDVEVPVRGYVEPCSPEPLIFGLKKELFSFTSKNQVTVKGKIEKTFLQPGENIALRLTINNDSDVPVNLLTELYAFHTYTSDKIKNNARKFERESVRSTAGVSPTLKEKSVSRLTCIVPTRASYTIQNSNVLKREYLVRVTARLPFPYFNEYVEIPVVIGEKKEEYKDEIERYKDDQLVIVEVPSTCDKYNEENVDTHFGGPINNWSLKSHMC